MPQTGKTSKKQASAAQATYKTDSRNQRFGSRLDNAFQVLDDISEIMRPGETLFPMSPELEARMKRMEQDALAKYDAKARRDRRLGQTEGRMSFEKRYPLRGTRYPVQTDFGVVAMPRAKQTVGRYKTEQEMLRDRMTENRVPTTRNRPRGKTVSGMMTGPLLAGLGDYIGRNTSVGQQLRSQMMKEQPSKKR
jgi:hypothetical protein